VIGGQNGINGAEVFLYAAPTTGYGAASTSLLKSPGYVTTATDGTFTITGDYTCPTATPNEQVYLYAVGGNPGSGTNSAAGLMAAIGPCPSASTLSSSLYIALNEISTVATAYAIAGFATDATHVSTGTTALASTDLANAFSSATNLETLGTGFALSTTPGGNGTVPASTINTLADILSACINSTGPTSTACSTLFSNAENSSSVKPTDTATAAINIAHNPGANVATLYGLLPTTGAPFEPTLASPGPNDWTISIVYSGGGIDYSAGVAIDKSGNVWTTDYSDNSISEFNTLGVPASSTGYTNAQLDGPGSIAIDSTGNVWTTNYSGNTLSEYVPGTGFNGTGFTGGGLTAPTWISIDKYGNLWVTNTATMSEFTSAGVARTTATGLTTGGLSGPQFSVADTSGNVWVANDNSGAGTTLSEFTSSATVLATANASSPYSGGGLEGPFGLAIDPSGNIWVGDWQNNDLSEFNSAGSAISGSPFNSHGGLSDPEGIAIDGAGIIWTANNGGNNLGEFNSTATALSPSTGYTSSLLSEPEMLAIDGSGNIWIPDKGGIGLTEFVGAATPVVTPMVANLLTPYGTKAVNKP
jgi:streptogramin lyase